MHQLRPTSARRLVPNSPNSFENGKVAGPNRRFALVIQLHKAWILGEVRGMEQGGSLSHDDEILFASIPLFGLTAYPNRVVHGPTLTRHTPFYPTTQSIA